MEQVIPRQHRWERLGKTNRRNRREIRPTKEAYDVDKTDPLPYKAEDDPLVITNKRPLNECEDQSLGSEPQTTLGSSRGTCTFPASDNN